MQRLWKSTALTSTSELPTTKVPPPPPRLSCRLTKTMAEKREVIDWIEENCTNVPPPPHYSRTTEAGQCHHLACDAGGNPEPPAVEVVARWVKDAWNAVTDSVVQNSIPSTGAGFTDNFEDWHITRHDVYGARLRQQ